MAPNKIKTRASGVCGLALEPEGGGHLIEETGGACGYLGKETAAL